MKRAAMAVAVLVTILAAAGCDSGGSKKSDASSTTTFSADNPVNINYWVYFTDPELGVMKQVVAEFEKTHPGIHVTTRGGIDDTKILASITAGKSPDVAESSSSDYSGKYCSSGAWIDLKDYMKRDNIPASTFPVAPRYYTQYKGNRCALPMLADAYGLYYNTDMFKKAGLTHSPRTMSELTQYAKKLTVRNSDGSLKVVGLDPVNGWYENAPAHWGPQFGAKWVDSKGNSVIAKSPGWKKFLQWQKDLVDWYGYKNLVKWQAGAGDEFSPSHAFERGKVAMNLDGEWRVSLIKKDGSTVKYATAPLPVDDSMPQLYGAGYTSGSILGIPKSREGEGGGLGAHQVPGHEHEGRGAPLERDRERADHDGERALAAAEERSAVRGVRQDLQQPEHGDDPGLDHRRPEPEPVQYLQHCVHDRAFGGPRERPGERGQPDQRGFEAGRRGRGAVS